MKKAATGMVTALSATFSGSSSSLWRDPQTHTQSEMRVPIRTQFSYLVFHIVSHCAMTFNRRFQYPLPSDS
jgi:hypothetical protein